MGKYHVIAPCKIGREYHKPRSEPIEVEDRIAKILVKSGSLKAAPKEYTQDPAKELLALTAEQIVEQLAGRDVNELKKLFGLEGRGQKRKGVLDAIDAAIENAKKH